MQLKKKVLNKLRRVYKYAYGLEKGNIYKKARVNTSINEYNKYLSELIRNGVPTLLTRFGSEELKWYLNLQSSKKSFFHRCISYIICRTEYYDRSELSVIENMTFLPNRSIESSDLFYKEYTKAIESIDILGTWLLNEKYLKLKNRVRFIELFNLEPYKTDIPWTFALEGKRVLVIHPMVDLIEQQWHNRTLLFDQPIWPENVELTYLKAKYFDEPDVDSWGKMLDYYKKGVDKSTFDVAIIGNGSWGLPIAAHIKARGKIAIHLGGATQLLFGIYGKRWENWTEYKSMFNQYWVSGSKAEQKPWFVNYDCKSYW